MLSCCTAGTTCHTLGTTTSHQHMKGTLSQAPVTWAWAKKKKKKKKRMPFFYIPTFYRTFTAAAYLQPLFNGCRAYLLPLTHTVHTSSPATTALPAHFPQCLVHAAASTRARLPPTTARPMPHASCRACAWCDRLWRQHAFAFAMLVPFARHVCASACFSIIWLVFLAYLFTHHHTLQPPSFPTPSCCLLPSVSQHMQDMDMGTVPV